MFFFVFDGVGCKQRTNITDRYSSGVRVVCSYTNRVGEEVMVLSNKVLCVQNVTSETKTRHC